MECVLSVCCGWWILDADGSLRQTFEDNRIPEGIDGELIVPAVKPSVMSVREKGVISLGLCCLISRVSISYTAHIVRTQTDGAQPNSGWL